MADIERAVRSGDLSFLDEDRLAGWLVSRRWFASKAREVTEFHVLGTIPLAGEEGPLMAIALVEVRFPAGTHELYQAPLGFRPADEGWDEEVICQIDGWTVYDALYDPACANRLLGAMRDGASVDVGEDSTCEFHAVGELPPSDRLEDVRSVGAEQSNSSIVFGDELILKAYRRIEPGPNPDLELLRFLTEHGFGHIARLAGWYEHTGRLVDATLGLMQEFVAGAEDGWERTVGALERGEGDEILDELHGLGQVIGRMHAVLGSDSGDPTFAPEEHSVEALALLTATVDEEIEQIFLALPDLEAVAPIAGRGEEVRDRLRLLSQVGSGGRVIRHHGDLHLGQTLFAADRGWVVLDFEGEPARSLPERRRKRSPLRDVAGMLRSFAYAASASELQRGVAAPTEWEQRARERFLAGYYEAVDPTLLPVGHDATERLLSVFELEKAVYELRYEMNNRPDWVAIPVAGIRRLLEGEVPA